MVGQVPERRPRSFGGPARFFACLNLNRPRTLEPVAHSSYAIRHPPFDRYYKGRAPRAPARGLTYPSPGSKSERGRKRGKRRLARGPDDHLRGGSPRSRRLPLARGEGPVGGREAWPRPPRGSSASTATRPTLSAPPDNWMARNERDTSHIDCCTFADLAPPGNTRRHRRHRDSHLPRQPRDALPRTTWGCQSCSQSRDRRRRRSWAQPVRPYVPGASSPTGPRDAASDFGFVPGRVYALRPGARSRW